MPGTPIVKKVKFQEGNNVSFATVVAEGQSALENSFSQSRVALATLQQPTKNNNAKDDYQRFELFESTNDVAAQSNFFYPAVMKHFISSHLVSLIVFFNYYVSIADFFVLRRLC